MSRKNKGRFCRILRKLRHSIRMVAVKEKWPAPAKKAALKGAVDQAAVIEAKVKVLSDEQFNEWMERSA